MGVEAFVRHLPPRAAHEGDVSTSVFIHQPEGGDQFKAVVGFGGDASDEDESTVFGLLHIDLTPHGEDEFEFVGQVVCEGSVHG